MAQEMAWLTSFSKILEIIRMHGLGILCIMGIFSSTMFFSLLSNSFLVFVWFNIGTYFYFVSVCHCFSIIIFNYSLSNKYSSFDAYLCLFVFLSISFITECSP
uniref:Uncharacterized protein n=1 Tax=Cacopsylla melanoneura TaxID=428564 RepID=A0A8D8QK41_9HEMI